MATAVARAMVASMPDHGGRPAMRARSAADGAGSSLVTQAKRRREQGRSAQPSRNETTPPVKAKAESAKFER
jgi:hypothetical protein